MLHILLLILKIIGILLGVLVGILLLGICLVLFVPVRYQIVASRTEGEGNPPIEATVKVTWLLRFLNVRLQYPAQVYLRVRLLFFTVFRLPRREKVEKTEPKKTKSGKTKKNGAERSRTRSADSRNDESKSAKMAGKMTGEENRPETGASAEPEKEEAFEEKEQPQTEGTDKTEETAKSGERTETKEKTKATQKLRAFFAKIRQFFAKIRQFFQNIWYTITGICDRIKTIAENIEYYWSVLQSDTFRSSFSLCKKELAGIWKAVRPRKLQADLVVGTGDPASTGQILSYYGILYPFIGHHVTVIGDFEQKRIEGLVHIKGKIRMFTLLKAGLHIFFSKDIRALLKLFKKEEQ